MGFLFKRRTEPAPRAIEPVDSSFPVMRDAEIAAVFAGERAAGDFYDSIRVSPNRVLFGLLDLAGKRETGIPVLAAAQNCFRSAGAELFSDSELNEAEAMVELARRLNLEIMRAAGGVRSCSAFAGCYNEELGTVCYVNAGHTPGLLCDQESIEELPATGLIRARHQRFSWKDGNRLSQIYSNRCKSTTCLVCERLAQKSSIPQ
jgi:serine phosphatase RsbU (regulator of sigma subunit)